MPGSSHGSASVASSNGGSPAAASSGSGTVREVPSSMPPTAAAQLFVLQRIVGPLRRRMWRVEPPRPPLSGQQILERVSRLPVSFWTYEFEPGVRHLGPMAQDFAAAFGLGRTNRMINPLDGIGVSLAAIKALQRRVDRLEAEVQQLRAAQGESQRQGGSD
jgi:hypothetical protein